MTVLSAVTLRVVFFYCWTESNDTLQISVQTFKLLLIQETVCSVKNILIWPLLNLNGSNQMAFTLKQAWFLK
jgi:hypothetical protein